MGFRPGFGTNQYQCQHFKKNLAPAFSFFVWGYLSAPWVQDEAQTHHNWDHRTLTCQNLDF